MRVCACVCAMWASVCVWHAVSGRAERKSYEKSSALHSRTLLLPCTHDAGMTAGVWDPAFEPMNSVLQEIVNPLGTAIVAAFGADNNINHTMYHKRCSALFISMS